MNQIPFVKVSIEEAKAALRNDAVWKSVAPPRPKIDWTAKRMSQDRMPPALHNRTFKWLANLPSKTRPYELAKQFPRIANRLAETWDRPMECLSHLDGLIMDGRGDRKGFPSAVATEIAVLKAHFLRTAAHMQMGVWRNRIGVD